MISQINELLIRRIILSGNVREDSAALFLEHITALECHDVSKPITVYIDTYGGSVDAGMMIYDTMKTCSCPIVTVGIGKVMSIGALLLAAGEPENRFITQNTRVMIHQISGAVHGTLSEMQMSVEESRRLQELYLELLAKEIGVSKSKILKDIELGDIYFSAEDAVKYGLADKILPTRKLSKPKRKATRTSKSKARAARTSNSKK